MHVRTHARARRPAPFCFRTVDAAMCRVTRTARLAQVERVRASARGPRSLCVCGKSRTVPWCIPAHTRGVQGTSRAHTHMHADDSSPNNTYTLPFDTLLTILILPIAFVCSSLPLSVCLHMDLARRSTPRTFFCSLTPISISPAPNERSRIYLHTSV